MTTMTTVTIAIAISLLLWVCSRIGWITQRGHGTRDEVLGLAIRRYRTVNLYGKRFRICSLTEDEKAAYEASILAGDGLDVDGLLSARRRLLCMCLVDGDGSPLFNIDENDKLGTMDGRAMSRLVDAVRDWAGFDNYDMAELASVADSMAALNKLTQDAAPESQGNGRTRNQSERDAMRNMFGGRLGSG